MDRAQKRQERIRKREAKTGLPCFVVVVVVGDRQFELDVDERRTWRWVLGKIQAKQHSSRGVNPGATSPTGMALA